MITFTGAKPIALRTAPTPGHPKGSALSSHGQVAKMWQLFMDTYLNNGPGGKPYPVERFPDKAGTGDDTVGGAPSPTPTVPTPGNSPGCQQGNCQTGGPTGGPTGGLTGGPTTPPPAQDLSANASNTGQPGKVRLSWDNHGQGGVNIDWGDGKTEGGGGGGVTSHIYTTGGNYTITVTDSDDPSRKVTVPVTVNLP